MSKKGGEGGVIANPKKFIANLRILSGFSGKKRNVISKKGRGGGGQGRLEVFQKTSIFAATVTLKEQAISAKCIGTRADNLNLLSFKPSHLCTPRSLHHSTVPSVLSIVSFSKLTNWQLANLLSSCKYSSSVEKLSTPPMQPSYP